MTETQVPVVSLWNVVAEYARKKGIAKIGVLGGVEATEKTILVAAYAGFELVFPSADISCCSSSEDRATHVVRVAEDLKAQGAELLLPWCEHAVEALAVLEEQGFPVCNPYVLVGDYVVEREWKRLTKLFKVGMIGGLGPAATVDLYDKITRFTPAKTDQEHIKVVVEQNPQTADRTACLLHGGDDPTLALYDCAKRLEKDGCDALIVPCNTAHAFVPFLERHIKVPFINMQRVTMEEIQRKLGKDARIGLLATSGTIQTGIYAEKAKAMGIDPNATLYDVLFAPSESRNAVWPDPKYPNELNGTGKALGLPYSRKRRSSTNTAGSRSVTGTISPTSTPTWIRRSAVSSGRSSTARKRPTASTRNSTRLRRKTRSSTASS